MYKVKEEIMNVWSHGNDRITFDDATNRYQFIMDDLVKVEITDTLVRVFNPRFGGGEIFSIHDSGGLYIQQDKFEMDTVGENYLLSVGRGIPGDMRGRVEIRHQPEHGRTVDEFYTPAKAGILVLYDERGHNYFLWVDSNGKLRISNSDPGANDLAGTVVGTQS
jgi:hypothetical protein